MTRGLIWPHKNNCFAEHYQPAGVNWFAGHELYQTAADTCRYSPLVHAFLVPFSILPEPWGMMLWRLFEGLSFIAAMHWWLRAVCPESWTGGQRAWVLVLAIPLAIGSLNNGQSNVFMMAGILAGVAAVSERRWNLGAVMLASACFLKIYPIAMAMLLIAMFPRQFAWRLAAALGAGLLLPFVLQDPEYVWRQYGRWFGNLEGDDRSNWNLYEAYRDVWMLTRISGWTISLSTYRLIQVGVGGILGLLCFRMRFRGEIGRDQLNLALGLGCCWMTAFGPATESPTYILLNATLAWLLVKCWDGETSRWTRLPATISALLFFIAGIAVTTPFGRRVLVLGPQPIAALLILATLVPLAWSTRAQTETTAVVPDAFAPRGKAA